MIVLVFATGRVEAHEPGTLGAKSVQAAAVDRAPLLDGDLEEPEWERVPVVSDFVQQEPQEGAEPSEKTEVRILYTRQALYVGVRCYDSAPEGIRATERRRDSDMDSDDSFWLILDTYHGHRDSYFFRTNPLGNQWDALMTDEGKVQNESWDAPWEVGAKIHAWGWAVEIKIPFKTLRAPSADEPVWGVDFKRFIRRKNEAVAWSNHRRDFEFYEVSQAGHLMGLSAMGRALNLRVKPYVAGGVLRARSGRDSLTDKDLEVGLEDVRYPLTPRLQLNATLNPDFAQAEVDEFRINLTRFPLFFEEKREFFLEDAGLFDFGAGGRGWGGRPDVKLLHTRRIGLTPQRRPIPILFGARLTGRLPGWSLAVMNVSTRDHQGIPGQNFGAYRAKRTLFARSYVGAMATHVTADSAGDNATLGLDANFRFLENLQFQSFVVRSQSSGQGGDGWSAAPFWLRWDSDRFLAEAQHLIVEPTFNPAAGFLSRSDMRRSTLGFEFKPRPQSEWLRQLVFGAGIEYLTDLEGTLRTRDQSVSLEAKMESGDALEFRYTKNMERQDEPFRLAGRFRVPPGVYRNDQLSWQFRPYDGRNISGFFRLSWEDFWGGERLTADFNPEVRWSDRFITELGYELERVSLPEAKFVSHILEGKFQLNFTNQWLTSTTLQYNHLDNEWGLNARLNYIYRPGDDLFVVFNRSRLAGETNWSILVKFTHTFDF
ncbi:MAG: carbohydrate binding family 9 domain-containing protein [Acidobacteria bacterium]|nr:carbohydrate binding family 9 domain-containing protein [Acidobacteriota bacterium]